MPCWICNPNYRGDELCEQCASYDREGSAERDSDQRQFEQQEFRDRNADQIETWRSY